MSPMIHVSAVDLLAPPQAAAHAAAVAAVGAAGRGNGVFVLTVDSDLLAAHDAALTLTRAFFALPAQTKAACASGGGNPRGYQGVPEGDGDVREKFLFTLANSPSHPLAPADSAMPGANRWPDDLPDFASALGAAIEPFVRAGLAVLGAMAADLGLAEADFAEPFAAGEAAVWLLHYPAVAPRDGQSGQGTSSHRDLHPLALILQDQVGGLELHGPQGWIGADPTGAPVVAQMGDIVARWSNDLYNPNVHRVRSPATESRFSVAIFLQPPGDFPIAPAPEAVTLERPARYRPTAFAACLAQWFSAIDEGTAGYAPVDLAERVSDADTPRPPA